MTVNASSRRAGPFIGTGLIVPYSFDFKIFSEEDVAVVRAVLATGATTELVLDSDYSVTMNADQDANPGGFFSYLVGGVATALPTTNSLTIYGDLPYTQPVDITNQGGFYPQVIEDALDRTVMLIQQNNDAVERSLQLNVATDPDFDVQMPAPVASNLLGWGPDGLSLQNYTPDATYPASVLAAQLASTASASDNSYLVGHGDALSYTPGPRVANYLRSYTTPLAYTGCPTNGTSDASTYVQAALSSGKKEIVIPGGFTFSVTNLSVPTGVRIVGEGTLKKFGAVVQPILTLADGAQDVVIEGITFDGDRAAFSTGNAVPAVLAYLSQNLRVRGVTFQNIVDCGLKIFNSGYLEVVGGRYFNIGENGIELKNYDVDPRTGVAYVGTLPPLQGGHKITGVTFAKIDNNSGDGSGDGCGILISTGRLAGGTLYPVKGVGVVNSDFLNVKRGVWVEVNDAGAESEDVQVIGNRFRGDVTAYGGDVYQAIGFIGAKRALAAGNNIINVGNMAVVGPGDSCNGIVVSGTSEDIELSNNTIIDNTGNTNRMDYAVRLTAGVRIKVVENAMSGASILPIYAESAGISEVDCHSNPGAQGSFSWGNTTSYTFRAQNIPGTATTAMTPEGMAIGDEPTVTAPMPLRLVGVSVRQSAAIGSGTITYNFYTNSVLRSSLTLTNADFSGGGAVASKTIGVTSGVTIAAGEFVRVDVVTTGFTPTTADALATLIFDTGFKE